MTQRKNGEQLYADLDKLKRVYLSCTTDEQLLVANNMWRLFEKKWKGNVSLSIAGQFYLKTLGASFNEMSEHREKISLHNT